MMNFIICYMVKSSINEKFNYKIVLIGDGRVGKTSLRRNFMGESFEANYLTTLMADFGSYTLELDDFNVNFSIWDLAGQQGLHDVQTTYYFGAFGAMIVFDITNPNSFENLDSWVKQLKRSTMDDGTPIVVVANKIDLEDDQSVPYSKVEEYVENLKKDYPYTVRWIKTSAKTGENVEDAFKILAKDIHAWKSEDA